VLRLKVQGKRYKITGIKFRYLVPSPMRDKPALSIVEGVRMRRLLKAVALFDFILLTPTLSSRRGSFLS